MTPECHTNHTNVCQISHTDIGPSSPHRPIGGESPGRPTSERAGLGHVMERLQRWIWFWQTLIWFRWQIWVINIFTLYGLNMKTFLHLETRDERRERIRSKTSRPSRLDCVLVWKLPSIVNWGVADEECFVSVFLQSSLLGLIFYIYYPIKEVYNYWCLKLTFSS